MKQKFLILYSLFTFLSFGQSFKIPDSIIQKSFKELETGFNKYIKTNSKLAELYCYSYKDKAIRAKDSFRITVYYFWQSRLIGEPDKRLIKIWDSAIHYGKNLQEEHYPEMLYNKRALAYGDFGYLKNQLEDYLTALKFSKQNNNKPYISIVKHNLADLKRKLGRYSEAKKLFKDVLIYDNENMIKNKGKWDTIYYLQSLSELASIYRLSNSLDSARILNDKGLYKSLGNRTNILFKKNDGIIDYLNGKTIEAEYKLNQVLNKLLDSTTFYGNDRYNSMETYLYLAKAKIANGKNTEAITNFRKIDSIAKKINFWLPEVISAYRELVNHYKSVDDKINQLKYINKLLKADSILTSNYKIVGDQMFKEFDAKELIGEKEQIITSLKKKNSEISTKNIVVSLLLILSLGIAGFYFYKQRLYKKRFLKLVADLSTDDTSKKSKSTDNGLGISEEIIQHLIECLQQFEDSKEYLNPNINMIGLAKSFNSNSNYLSKVINKYKGKSFSQYINDLRVNYVIDKLKNDPVFRKYTVLALGQEIGFNNSESFSKAFYKNTGIYPSYFIKELLKQ